MRTPTPCADCGKPMNRGKGSLPAGQATCQECRRARHPNACTIYPRDCAECGTLFIARDPRWPCCSDKCSIERGRRRRNKSTPASRNKHHRRRAIERVSDITPAYEGALRSKTRKCKLCGAYMTSKPDSPNSKHLDHIIPIGIGGTHTIGNVRIICRTCNLARPKDGSDYHGPVTLWAQVRDVVITPKPQPPPAPRVVKARCSCGNEITHGQTSRCAQCLHELTLHAATMRDAGMKWQEICDALGYANTGSLYGRVMKIRRPATATASPVTSIGFSRIEGAHDPPQA